MKTKFHKLLFAIAHLFIFSQISAYFCAGSIWYKDDVQNKRHWVYLLGDSENVNHLATTTDKLMHSSGPIPDWDNRLSELRKYIAIEQEQVHFLDAYILNIVQRKPSSIIILLEGHPIDSLAQRLQQILGKSIGFFHTIRKVCTAATSYFIDPRHDSAGHYYYDFSSHVTFPLSNQQRKNLTQLFDYYNYKAQQEFESLTLHHQNNQKFQEYSRRTFRTCCEQSLKVFHELRDGRMQDSRAYYDRIMSASKIYRELLDVNIIHNILDNFEKEHIFVCCGNKHREAINKGLGELGYSLHYTKTDTLIHQAGNGRYFDEMEPLDMETFLQQQQAQLETPPEQQRPQNPSAEQRRVVYHYLGHGRQPQDQARQHVAPMPMPVQQQPQRPVPSKERPPVADPSDLNHKESSNSSFINSFLFWTGAGLLATAAVYGIYWLYTNNSIGGK